MTALPLPHLSAALARPGHPALVTPEGTTWTWAELASRAARRAHSLLDQGVGPGSVVALAGEARPSFVVELHALWQVGAVVAPLNPRATDAELRAALRAIAPQFVSAPEPGRLQATQRAALATTGAARLLTPGLGAAPAPERPWPLDEVRLIILTSGTSRRPRPMRLTTSQLVFSAFGSAVRLGHHLDDRWLACLPLHHIGGLSILLRCALYATTVELHPAVDLTRIAARLDSGEITLVSLSPSLLSAVLDARPEAPLPPAVRAILLGGAATPAPLLDRARALGLPLAITWGMTEAASQISTRLPGDLSADGGSGPPLPFARVEARDDGALVVRGPVVGGDLITNDHGHIDAEGRVQVGGRRDDVIVSGGVNLSPAEIEQALLTHPAVADAGVVGVADAQWGHRPVAVLVAATPGEAGEASARPDAAALRAHCADRLTGYKVPDRFVWVSALPRGALGKLSRRRLLALVGGDAQAHHGLDEGRGPGRGLEGRQGDEGVLEPNGGAQVGRIVGAGDLVGEGHRPLAPGLDAGADRQPVAAPHGPPVVGGGVHQGQAEVAPLEHRVAPLEGGAHQLLEGHVRVLEVAREEDDPDRIRFVEAGGEGVLEGHETTLSGSLEEA